MATIAGMTGETTPCDKCTDGRVWKEAPWWKIFTYYERIPCPHCGGTGKVIAYRPRKVSYSVVTHVWFSEQRRVTVYDNGEYEVKWEQIPIPPVPPPSYHAAPTKVEFSSVETPRQYWDRLYNAYMNESAIQLERPLRMTIKPRTTKKCKPKRTAKR